MWAPDGQSFKLSYMSIRGREIKLSAFCDAVMKEGEELKELLKSTFPCVDLATFKISKIKDDPGRNESPFSQDVNVAYLKPFRNQIWAHLGHPKYGSCSCDTPHPLRVYSANAITRTKNAEKWLEGPRRILEKQLVHFYKTIGIPPRSWQTSELLYEPLGQYVRNLRILRYGLTVICNPKAKQKDKLQYEAFWALPPHLALSFVFYLGVIRPVEIELLQDLKRPNPDLHHYIFVTTQNLRPLQPSIYTAQKINQLLVDGPPEHSYESRVYRTVMQSIYDNHICTLRPQAVADIMREGGDGQGQHTQNISDLWYRNDEISLGTGLPMSKRNLQLGISTAFHSWYHFLPSATSWNSHANYQSNKEKSLCQILAFSAAQCLILTQYEVSRNSKETASKVASLISMKPYLFGPKVSMFLVGFTLL